MKETTEGFGCYNEANGMKNEKIESLPASELDFLLWNFFLNARKKNGEEYEPATVSSFQRSIQRYLSEKKYPFNILKDNEFEKSRKVLAAKRKSLVLTRARQRKQTASCSGHRRRRRGCTFLILNSTTPIQLRFKELCGGFYTTLRSPGKRISVKRSVTVFHRSSFYRCKRRIHQQVHIPYIPW